VRGAGKTGPEGKLKIFTCDRRWPWFTKLPTAGEGQMTSGFSLLPGSFPQT
jgi:hypothetical protein